MKRHRDERVVRRVVYQTVCDNCDKIADGEDPEGWYYFRSWHSDWGSESDESLERWDVCSYRCYLAVVRKIFEDYDKMHHNPTLSIDNKDWAFLNDMLSTEKVS